jgi:hypothetical protein
MRLWVFADFKPLNDNDLKLLESLNVTDVVLGLADSKPSQFKPKFTDEKLRSNVKELRNLNIDPHFMIWIKRHQKFINESCKYLLGIEDEFKPRSILLDAESHWHEGSIASNTASKLIEDNLTPIMCKLGVTGLAVLKPSVKSLLRICDYGLPQAYSIWKPNDSDHWSHSKTTEPGRLQRTALSTWGVEDKPIVMGLACYWTARPNLGQIESMRIALDTTITLGNNEVAYWSLKHLHNSGHAKQRAEFISNIKLTKIPTINANIQFMLNELGYSPGNSGPNGDGVDNIWGPKSQRALDKFIEKNGNNHLNKPSLELLNLLVYKFRINV